MDALCINISNIIYFCRNTNHHVYLRLHFPSIQRHKEPILCGLFSSIINVAGICVGLFIFKTLDAIAWCITITFSISFLQCYYQMYYITFRRSIIHLGKQFLSPILLGSIVFLTLFLITPFITPYSLFINLIIKSVVFIGIDLTYIHITKEYNLVKLLKFKA